jgi:hypothetical protein
MGKPISVRLEAQIQSTLEAAAKARGIGVSTYLRELAEREAARVRRERIRAQSAAVGAYVAGNVDGRAFCDDWGAPTSEPPGNARADHAPD